MATGRIANARHCHVYLAVAATGQVKIGRSVNPQTRLGGIQTGSPVRVSIEHSWKLTTPEAVAFEKVMHRLFRWARVSGEWHGAGLEDVIEVGNRYLAGDTEGAEALSRAVATADEAFAAYDRASTAARSRSLWGRTEERAAAAERAEELRLAWHEASDLAYELGRPDPLGLSPAAQVRREQERDAEEERIAQVRAARASSPKAKWQIGAKAALANYKAERGLV